MLLRSTLFALIALVACTPDAAPTPAAGNDVSLASLAPDLAPDGAGGCGSHHDDTASNSTVTAAFDAPPAPGT